MKNLILPLTLSIVSLASCTTPIEEMTNDAITEVKSQLLDPKSFELISTKVDTIRYTWTLQKEFDVLDEVHQLWMDQSNKELKDAEWNLAFRRSAATELKYAQIYLDSARVKSAKMNLLIEQMEALTDTPNDSIIGYTVNVRYYATNRGGEKQMGENLYYVFNNGKTDLEDISPLTASK